MQAGANNNHRRRRALSYEQVQAVAISSIALGPAPVNALDNAIKRIETSGRIRNAQYAKLEAARFLANPRELDVVGYGLSTVDPHEGIALVGSLTRAHRTQRPIATAAALAFRFLRRFERQQLAEAA